MPRKFLNLDQFQEYFKAKKRGVPHLLSPATAEGKTESFDGTPIHWELRGPKPSETKNPTMVFCYGLVCSMNQWRFQIERYSKDHPCITLDYRGHHESGIPVDKNSLNLSAIARDVAAVMDAVQVKKPAHVWGHSMGANVALELAAQEPKRIQSLILVCGTPINPFKNMFNTSALEKVTGPLLDLYERKPEVIETLWQVFLSEPRLAKWISSLVGFNALASKSFDREAYALAVANIEPQVFFPLLRDLTRGMTQNILAQVKAPALVIAGAKDFITPPHVQRELATGLPHGEYAEITLGSHNVQLDFGEYVCLKVEEFWKKL